MGRKPKYNEDLRIFDDKEKLSYLTGLIAADGHLPKRLEHRNKVVLTSCKEDAPYIFSLSQSLVKEEYTPVFCPNEYSGNYMMSLTLPSLRQFLESVGVGPLKSSNLKVNLDKLEPLYFLRGYIDGDGCVSCSSKSRKIEIVSSCLDFSRQIQFEFGGKLMDYGNVSRIIWNTSGSVDLARDLPIMNYMLERKSIPIYNLRSVLLDSKYDSRRKTSNYAKI